MKTLNTTPTNNQKGFSFIEILLVLTVLGVIVFIGSTVLNRQNDSSSNDSNNTTTSQTPEINNAQDLQQAEDTLDDINLDGLDTTELDAAEADLL